MDVRIRSDDPVTGASFGFPGIIPTMLVHVEPGMSLGRYKVVRPVGVGGMAEVWEAVDEVLKRTVAIKLVLPSFTTEKEFTSRFLREARLAAFLEHPNILPVYDVGTFEDRPFLVTPLLQGGRLLDKMAEHVPDSVAVQWLVALANALDHAHAHQVVHRDVKPANVLFDKKDKPYLSDFGIAKSLEESTILTQDGAVVGTPAYMSPEQAMSAEISPAADQYSLGVMAYRLLSGQLPFDRKTPTPVLLHKAIYETPPPPSKYRPALGPRVDAVFQRVLDKKPERRYRSCSDFVRNLYLALASAALVEGPAGRLDDSPDSEALTAPDGFANARDGRTAETGFTTQPVGPGESKTPPSSSKGPSAQSGSRPTQTGGTSLNPNPGRTAFVAGVAVAAVLVIAGVFALKGLLERERSKEPLSQPVASTLPAAATEPTPSAVPSQPFKGAAPEDQPLPTVAVPSPTPEPPAPVTRTAVAAEAPKPKSPTATRPARATSTPVPPTATAMAAPTATPAPIAAPPTPTRPAPIPTPTAVSRPQVPGGPVRIEEATLSTVSARVKDPSLVLTFKFDRPISPPAPGSIRIESIISGATGSFLLRTGVKDLSCQPSGNDSVICPLGLRVFDQEKRRQLRPESELEITVSIGSKKVLKAVRFLESD